MICAECGKETPEDSLFCENCGHPITRSDASDEQLRFAEGASEKVDAPTIAGAWPAIVDSWLEEGDESADGVHGQTEDVQGEASAEVGLSSEFSGVPAEGPAVAPAATVAVEPVVVVAAELTTEPAAVAAVEPAPEPAVMPARGALDASAAELEFEPIDDIGPIAVKESGEGPDVAPISIVSDDEEPLVYSASLPDQPNLGRVRVAVIGVVSALFGVALIMVCCILVMNLLGI